MQWGWAIGTAIIALLFEACTLPRRLPDCVESRPAGEGPSIETGGDPVLLAAGDILDESRTAAGATAALLDGYDGLVATLGDNLNTHGAIDDYFDEYELTWGRHRWRTRPSVGNHDYMAAHAAAYYAYFCAAAGTPFEGWYSYDLGAWHVVVLNSMCADASGEGPACTASSPQLRWLAADLAAHPSRCTLAYWHHPLFSSDHESEASEMRPAWELLHRAGAELVLNGHVHTYERFAPMRPDGVRDEAGGIRELVVGTGGAPLFTPPVVRINSERQVNHVFGVARLTLRPASYDWQFISVDGEVLDEGSAPCH